MKGDRNVWYYWKDCGSVIHGHNWFDHLHLRVWMAHGHCVADLAHCSTDFASRFRCLQGHKGLIPVWGVLYAHPISFSRLFGAFTKPQVNGSLYCVLRCRFGFGWTTIASFSRYFQLI